MSRPAKTKTATGTSSTSTIKKTSTSKVSKGTKGGAKKLSPYNKFMKTELAKVKLATPGIPHKEAFKKAAQNWATAAENPKVVAAK
ncbi:hypothetical protein IWW50_005685 [Coemansia erecta]|nr:hypothetical protein IWW50_005685 [Coemansia erecta]